MIKWTNNENFDADDANWMSDRVINRYGTTADRDASIPNPVRGMVAFIFADESWRGYTNAGWKKFVMEDEAE